MLCALLALGAFSCKKDEAAPAFDLDAMRACHLRGNTDSLAVARSLVGKWDWRFSRCDGNMSGSAPVRDLLAEFKADGTLTLYEDGQPVQSSPWQLEYAGGITAREYRLRLSTRIAQVAGVIYVCGDQVVFSESPLDVCDNYYRRGK